MLKMDMSFLDEIKSIVQRETQKIKEEHENEKRMFQEKYDKLKAAISYDRTLMMNLEVCRTYVSENPY